MNIDGDLKQLLLKAGWIEGRLIDESKLQHLMIEAGYEILPEVLKFLVSFDGIIIRFFNLKTELDDDISISFEWGNDLVGNGMWIKEYQTRIGKRICVIGTAYRDHFVLLMDEQGAVYGGYDSYLVKIGDSGIESLYAIIENKEFWEIK